MGSGQGLVGCVVILWRVGLGLGLDVSCDDLSFMSGCVVWACMGCLGCD